RVRVAYPGDYVLVAQHALDLGPPAVKDGGERGDVKVVRQRLWSERRDTRHVFHVPDKVDGQPLLRPLLGQVEPGPVVKDEPEGQRALPWLDRLVRHIFAPAEPARAREVENKVEIAVGTGGSQVKELAAPTHLGDRPPAQRGQGRVECLQ